MDSLSLRGIMYGIRVLYVSNLFYKCQMIIGHIGFWIRVESTTKTTAEAFQPANTRGCDADTMPVEVLRGG
jgi:hypothetical protein